MGKRWQLSAIAHYSSGFPYTPILAIQRDVEAPREASALQLPDRQQNG